MTEVRAATPDDLVAVLALDRRCFPQPWSEAAWLDELRRGAVSVVGQPMRAFACATLVLDVCELRRIAVAPHARRTGLARDLLMTIIAHARESACARIDLEVAARNEAAVGLYRSCGFHLVGRRPSYYRAPVDDALLMSLFLDANDV